MGDFDKYTNTADQTGKGKPKAVPSANSFDGWEKKGVEDYPNLSPDVVAQVKSTQNLQKATAIGQGLTNPVGTIGKAAGAVMEHVLPEKVTGLAKDAANAYEKGAETIKEAIDKNITKPIQDSAGYKFIDSLGRPDEDNEARDGRPGRVEPHGLCAFKQKVLNLCVQNAIVNCSYGITYCKMDATPSPRVHGVGNPMNNPFLTINDHVMFLNMFPYNLFTLCSNLANPFVAIATAAATAAKMGVFTLQPWPCAASAPMFNFFPWIPTQFKVLRGFVPVLTDQSKLLCWPGGIISFAHHGQGLDASFLKAMFMGPGGIEGLLNLTGIAGTALKGAGSFAKEGSKAQKILSGAQAANDFVAGGLNFTQGDYGEAFSSFGSGFGNIGNIGGDGSKLKKFGDIGSGAMDVAGVGYAASTGDLDGATNAILMQALKDNGLSDENAEFVSKLQDLNSDTTEYTKVAGAGNVDFTDAQKDMVEMTGAVDPEYGKITQQTFEQNDMRQAEINKQMAQQNTFSPEIEEPSKPPQTVPLEKSTKPGTKMPSSDWNPSGSSSAPTSTASPSTKAGTPPAGTTPKNSNPFDLGEGSKYLD